MKYFLIFLIVVGFAAFTQQSFAWCPENSDWDGAPCYATAYQNFTREKIQDDWAPYYDYKGKEWMEQKKTELITAIRDGTHHEWREESDANSNVFDYYYAFYEMDKYAHSPLKQFKSGVLVDEIQCKNYKHVLVERPNGKPACVYYSTAEKLDWTVLYADSNMTSIIFEVLKNEKLFDVEYYLKGGTVQDMIYDVDANVLAVTVDATNKGNLTIHIPRSLIDAKMDYCPPRNANASDDMFFVLIDGAEVSYDEISTTSETRTLQIPFIDGISDIEIIGTCYI